MPRWYLTLVISMILLIQVSTSSPWAVIAPLSRMIRVFRSSCARVLNETIGEHLVTLLSAGAACSATARTTEAAEEGLAAFVEKREPVWP